MGARISLCFNENQGEPIRSAMGDASNYNSISSDVYSDMIYMKTLKSGEPQNVSLYELKSLRKLSWFDGIFESEHESDSKQYVSNHSQIDVCSDVDTLDGTPPQISKRYSSKSKSCKYIKVIVGDFDD